MRRFLHTLGYLVALHVLGLLLLSACRMVQFAALHGMMQEGSGASVAPAFVRGLWFDNVVVCYVMLLPLAVLLSAAAAGWCPRWLRRTAALWVGALLTVALAVSAANIPYFAYFFKNLDSSIFGWFGYVGTTVGMMVGESSYVAYFLLFAATAALLWWGIRRLRRKADRLTGDRAYMATPWRTRALCGVSAVAVVALCLFGIRGRMGYNPIKVSQAYYCDDPFLNQLGISPTFNLLTSTLDGLRSENAMLRLMPSGEAISYVRQCLGVTGSVDSTAVLRRHVAAAQADSVPLNVVVIIMESMSANFMQAFGQPLPLTPTLDSLYGHSLAFSRCYSAGIHTNHGLTATLYSFPAMMKRNLMKGTVTPRRSGLPTVLRQRGYHNMFFMTHESQYDNMNAFFRTNGYDEVYAQEDYPRDEVVNAFGVPDRFLFSFALQTINRQVARKQPFMATILTISNHPPYVIPGGETWRSSEAETQIVEYADRCLGEFLAQARRQPWYDSTLFVVLADHGKLVGEMDSELPQSYNHIPCFIFGPGVPRQVYDGLATQVDVMPTLLGLLGIGYDYDGFGIDLLRQRRDRVFYTSDTHVVARDTTALYLYSPQMDRNFCYDLSPDGTLHPASMATHFDSLRHYVFAMEQTAEWMYRR